MTRKWKYLRDYMRTEMAKLPKKRSGDAGGAMVKSTWQFYPLMLFLKDQLVNRKSDGNLQCSRASTELDESDEETPQDVVSETQHSEVIMEESQSNQQMAEDSSESAISSPSRTDTVKEPRVAIASRKRARPNEAYGQALLNIERKKMEYLQEKMSKKSIIPEVNDDKMFFDSLLPFVTKIPCHLKLLFRSQVQELVQKFAFDGSLEVSPNRNTDCSYMSNSLGQSTSFSRSQGQSTSFVQTQGQSPLLVHDQGQSPSFAHREGQSTSFAYSQGQSPSLVRSHGQSPSFANNQGQSTPIPYSQGQSPSFASSPNSSSPSPTSPQNQNMLFWLTNTNNSQD